MTDARFVRLDVSDLQQLISNDIDSIGDFYFEGFRVILEDVFGFTDGVISGLLPTTDNTNVMVAANGKLIQDGSIGTSTLYSEAVVKPGAGYRTDIIVAQVAETQENEEPRLFLVSPDSDTQTTSDTYVEKAVRVDFNIVQGDTGTPDTPPAVPTGWVLLAYLTVTTTTITVDDQRSYSNIVEANELITDPNTYISNIVESYDYLTGITTQKNGSGDLNDIDTINFIEGSGVVISHVTPGSGVLNLQISTDFDKGVKDVYGTSGSVIDADTLTFAAGTGVASINVTNPSGDIAEVTINATGSGGSIGVLGLTREEQLGSAGVLTGGKYRFTLTSISYTPGNDDLLVYLGGQLLKKSTDYDEVDSTNIDLYDDPGSTNAVTFLYTGDSGVTIGIDVIGTAGAGATEITNLKFLAGTGVDDITVTESPSGTANVTIDINSTLVDGSNADALHTHSGSAGGWTTLPAITYESHLFLNHTMTGTLGHYVIYKMTSATSNQRVILYEAVANVDGTESGMYICAVPPGFTSSFTSVGNAGDFLTSVNNWMVTYGHGNGVYGICGTYNPPTSDSPSPYELSQHEGIRCLHSPTTNASGVFQKLFNYGDKIKGAEYAPDNYPNLDYTPIVYRYGDYSAGPGGAGTKIHLCMGYAFNDGSTDRIVEMPEFPMVFPPGWNICFGGFISTGTSKIVGHLSFGYMSDTTTVSTDDGFYDAPTPISLP